MRENRHRVKSFSANVSTAMPPATIVHIPTAETMERAARIPELTRVNCCLWTVYVPLFTLAASAAQVACFYAIAPTSSDALGLPVPCPPAQWYRTLTNMFAHSDDAHLWINVGSTLILGSILETRNGFVRIAPIWYLSAFVGTAFHALISDRPVRIVGSSGGVYALLAALLAELVMNWREMRYRWLYLTFFVVVLILEVVLVTVDPQPNVAYGAHFFGALYGFAVGLCVVKNWRWRRFEYVVFFAALLFAMGSLATISALLPRIFE